MVAGRRSAPPACSAAVGYAITKRSASHRLVSRRTPEGVAGGHLFPAELHSLSRVLRRRLHCNGLLCFDLGILVCCNVSKHEV